MLNQRDLGMGGARYCIFSAASGLAWGGIAYLLLGEWFPGLWVGIAISPLLGLIVGQAHRATYRFPVVARVLVALVTLYATAALFGLVIGAVEAVIETNPNVIKSSVVIEWVLVTLYGVTFTGYFLFLWPLAFLNHWLLGLSWRRVQWREGASEGG